MRVIGCADRSGTAIGQGLIAVACFAAIAVYPVGRTELLLIPTTNSLAATIDLALAKKARLVGTGPIRRSVRVTGDAAKIIGPMLQQGTMVIAVPAALCAGSAAGEGDGI